MIDRVHSFTRASNASVYVQKHISHVRMGIARLFVYDYTLTWLQMEAEHMKGSEEEEGSQDEVRGEGGGRGLGRAWVKVAPCVHR